jgi:ABC-type glycerol-3-phosphate transport system substrate-binding protein
MCTGQKDMLAEFNEANTDVQAEGVEWSWGNYLATLTAAVSAGEAPDVMHVGWGEVVSLGRPYFITIDDYITDDLKTNIREASWTSSRLGDKTYGIPVTEQLNEVLYYRKDVWDNAGISAEPQTWDEFVATAKALQEAGISDAWGMQAQGAPIVTRFLETQFQNGSPVFVEEGDAWVHTLNTPEAIEAGQFWYDIWRTDQVVSQSNLQRSTSDLVPIFAEGNMGMLYDIVQAYFSLRDQYPDMADQIHIAPIMTHKQGATMGGAFALSIFQQADDKDAAWKFVEWATSADIMNRYWVPQAKVLPTRVDVDYPEMPDHILARFQEYQAVQSVFPFIPEWETIKGRVLTPILGQMASEGGLDFETGWQNLIDQTEFVIGA